MSLTQASMPHQGLFVGIITGDISYLVSHFPESNEKMTALDQSLAAGGPATNAAVAFTACGSRASILGVLGRHPLAQMIQQELTTHDVKVVDLQPEFQQLPPISSIITTQATAERAVVSINSQKTTATIEQIPPQICKGQNIVLIDGHQMSVGAAIATAAQQQNIPVVVDAGSWKPQFETVLRWADYVICSANFYPPQCQTPEEIVHYLQALNSQTIGIAITRGEDSILWWHGDRQGEIAVPQIKAVDTLGAGDIFHGAFCHYILQQDFVTALTSAAQVASYSCQFFGTRAWLAGDAFGGKQPVANR